MKQGDKKLRHLLHHCSEGGVLATTLEMPHLNLLFMIRLVRDWRSTAPDERPVLKRPGRCVACAFCGERTDGGRNQLFACSVVSMVDMVRSGEGWPGFLATLAHEYTHCADSLLAMFVSAGRFKRPTEARQSEFRARVVETFVVAFSAWGALSNYGAGRRKRSWKMLGLPDLKEFLK